MPMTRRRRRRTTTTTRMAAGSSRVEGFCVAVGIEVSAVVILFSVCSAADRSLAVRRCLTAPPPQGAGIPQQCRRMGTVGGDSASSAPCDFADGGGGGEDQLPSLAPHLSSPPFPRHRGRSAAVVVPFVLISILAARTLRLRHRLAHQVGQRLLLHRCPAAALRSLACFVLLRLNLSSCRRSVSRRTKEDS